MSPEEKMIEELTEDRIPTEGKCKEIVAKIGVQHFVELVKILGGTTFYLPKLDRIIKPVRDQHIINEYTGYNHYELAMKYNISERWIRELCGEGSLEGQTSLFLE